LGSRTPDWRCHAQAIRCFYSLRKKLGIPVPSAIILGVVRDNLKWFFAKLLSIF
jgi:hypothetical protein